MVIKAFNMQTVNVANAKAHLSQLLDQVESGEAITITRNGRPIATLQPLYAQKKPLNLARLDAVRSKLPPATQSSVELIRQLRESRY